MSRAKTYILLLLCYLVLASCTSRGPALAAQSPIFHPESANPEVLGFLDKNDTYWKKTSDGRFSKELKPKPLRERSLASTPEEFSFKTVPTLFEEKGALLF